MKSLHLLFPLPLCLLLVQCQKANTAPQLPPETTTGANTFGCKVDGQVFIPHDARSKPGFYAIEYVNLGAVRDGGYHLNLSVVDWSTDTDNAVSLATDSLLVEEGKTYQFQPGRGNAQAVYSGDAEYEKLASDSGQLTITRFDRTRGILSGRFEFVGTDRTTHRQVHVTDGRFDITL